MQEMQQSAILLNSSISGLFHGSKGLIQLLTSGNLDAQLVWCCHSFTWKNYWMEDLIPISTALCFGVLGRPGKCSLYLFLRKEKSPVVLLKLCSHLPAANPEELCEAVPQMWQFCIAYSGQFLILAILSPTTCVLGKTYQTSHLTILTYRLRMGGEGF